MPAQGMTPCESQHPPSDHAEVPRPEAKAQPPLHDEQTIATSTVPAPRAPLNGEEPPVNQVEQRIMKLWTLHPESAEPIEVRVPVGITPSQLTQAERKLGDHSALILPKSWMNTPLDLYEPLQEHQLARLGQLTDLASKCLYVHPEAQPPQIAFPCARLHALRKQGA